MKTYKAKSLFYFSGFLMASLLYYGVEQYREFQAQFQKETVVDLSSEEFEDADLLVDELQP